VQDKGHIIYNDANKPVRMVGAMRDITPMKTAAIEREKITADLIQRNKDLEQFTYIVSHNLRAPVANIIGLCDMLADEAIDDEMKKEIVTGLNASSEKLDGVITDLNHVLQLKNGLIENKVAVYFADVVNDILTSITSLIEREEVQIKFDFGEAEKIITVKSYLYSIFYNLITNSIKYRQPALTPVIEIRSYKCDDKIVIVFTDNGMGINLSAKREQVFGLYKRFHTHIEGKGLGLFMTKTQVETLGGRISVSSEVNKGTTFKIEFDI
jgi:signal transduction histidine kinase